MTEVILVVLRRPNAATSLLAAAEQFAGLMSQARINVMAARQPVVSGAFAAEALIGEADAFALEEQAEVQRMAALKAAYEAWSKDAEAAGLTARWFEPTTNPGQVVGELGSRAEIIVCGRPTDPDHRARQELSAALFGTDRPVLLVPPGGAATIGQRVVIAWRDEKRAMRAVIPALRWIAKSKETHILIGLRNDAVPPPQPRVFTEHGIRPECHVLKIGSEPFGRTLLEKAHELSADLLIMGAYAHSPLRELILGGVTRYMLQHADLPVLMRH